VASVDELRALPGDAFAAIPPDPAEQEAWRAAYFASRPEGVLAEGAFRRLDGELVRVRSAILEEADGRFRALFYPVERPTTKLSAKMYRSRTSTQPVPRAPNSRPRSMSCGRSTRRWSSARAVENS